jgi:hypothetical protein
MPPEAASRLISGKLSADDPYRPDENTCGAPIFGDSPMQVTLLRTLITVMGGVVLVSSGCERESEGWPPVSSQLLQEFRQKQDGLEVLADELVDNGYSSVAIWGDGSLRATVYGGDGYEEVKVEDPQKWDNLFGNAGVDTAEKYSDEIRLHNRFEHAGIFDDKVYDYEFVKSAETYPILICEPRLSGATCGGCDERIDSDWYLRILWYPSEWMRAFDDLDDPNSEQFVKLMSEMQSNLGVCLEQFFDEHSPFETTN